MTARGIIGIALFLLSHGGEIYKLFCELVEYLPKTPEIELLTSKTSGKGVLPDYGPDTADELQKVADVFASSDDPDRYRG